MCVALEHATASCDRGETDPVSSRDAAWSNIRFWVKGEQITRFALLPISQAPGNHCDGSIRDAPGAAIVLELAKYRWRMFSEMDEARMRLTRLPKHQRTEPPVVNPKGRSKPQPWLTRVAQTRLQLQTKQVV
eukprot:801495-Prorocentrum_minimum.AAC.1